MFIDKFIKCVHKLTAKASRVHRRRRIIPQGIPELLLLLKRAHSHRVNTYNSDVCVHETHHLSPNDSNLF